MKKNLWGLAAFALAIAFTSFTVLGKKTIVKGEFVTRYATYMPPTSGTDPQTKPENYTVQSMPPDDCLNDLRLCWIQFEDANNNGQLDPNELNAYFLTHDTNTDKSLDDEDEIPGELEKRQ
jgi:hypothetical protein